MKNRDKEMIVAGVMSGTSADGIDVAIVRISTSKPGSRELGPRAASPTLPRGQKCPRHIIKLVGHRDFPYPPNIRAAVLAAMNAAYASVADLSRLNFLLGVLYADAVLATQRRLGVKIQLVGCHGQTLYHQGDAQPFLGKKIATTWQMGEAAIIAARVGAPVVSDFRPADMVAGGKGAPLVPYLDYLWFRDGEVGRMVQNIGGIANLTAIPAGAGVDEIFAFDSGPGNMVIDAVTQKLFAKPFDRGGQIATTGNVLEPVITRILRQSFFHAKPPKTAGREEFGSEFVTRFLKDCGRTRRENVVATATALTARSIADAARRFVIPKNDTYRQIVVSGGGAKNRTLIRMLAQHFSPMKIGVRFSDEFGLPSQAKEAVAFAVMAYETWHHRPSNVPSATGATRPAVLGKISYGS
jgi:anhydro-N-acetylmuramic acid kinase